MLRGLPAEVRIMPEIQGVNHVALTVTNVEKSFAWYEKVLGVQKLMDMDEGDQRATITLMGPLVLGLRSHGATGAGDVFAETRVGLDHVGFACADKAAVEEWAAHLDSVGVAHSGVIDSGYGYH